MSRPGMPIEAYGSPSAASVIGTGASHRTAPAAVLSTMCGAGPNPFWWNV